MTLAERVESIVAILGGLPDEPLDFDTLVLWVRTVIPEADVCEIDAAARPYERGEPGKITYEARS